MGLVKIIKNTSISTRISSNRRITPKKKKSATEEKNLKNCKLNGFTSMKHLMNFSTCLINQRFKVLPNILVKKKKKTG